MKSVKIIGYRLAAIVLLAMLPIVMSAVEYKNSYKPSGVSNHRAAGVQVTAPSATFQSTSTLTGSGSVLSATPMLNADGTVSAPSGPRRAKMEDPVTPPPPDTDDEKDEGNVPLGDAVLPLLLLAGVYLSVRVFLRRKRALSR